MTIKVLDTSLFDLTGLQDQPTDLLEGAREPFQYPKMEADYHYKWEPSDECRENTAKLAAYLAALPEGYRDFHMETWARTNRSQGDILYPKQVYDRALNADTQCGTVACACGHGPMAGIKPRPHDTGWGTYSDQFTCGSVHAMTFFFAGDWSAFDNTPQGAAKRMEYALQHGIPESDRSEWVDYLQEHGL